MAIVQSFSGKMGIFCWQKKMSSRKIGNNLQKKKENRKNLQKWERSLNTISIFRSNWSYQQPQLITHVYVHIHSFYKKEAMARKCYAVGLTQSLIFCNIIAWFKVIPRKLTLLTNHKTKSPSHKIRFQSLAQSLCSKGRKKMCIPEDF